MRERRDACTRPGGLHVPGRLAVAVLAAALVFTGPARRAFAGTGCLINENPPAHGATATGSIVPMVGFTCPPAGPVDGGGHFYAGTFNITVDGDPTLGYCIDITHPISNGQCEPQAQFPDLPCEAVWILNNYYPKVASPPGALASPGDEAAATQIAIWHFTDCFTAEPDTDSDILDRADQIIADAANHHSCVAPTAPQNITITPPSATNVLPQDPQHCATAHVADTNGDPVAGIEVVVTVANGPSGSVGPITGTTDQNGDFPFCYSNANLLAGGPDHITATAHYTVSTGIAFKQQGIQGIVIAGQDADAAATGTAVKNWVTNQCGDGSVNQVTEQCDDGNQVNGDGCDNNCTPSTCGNGIVAGNEQCDDGNTIDGDGCDSNCTPTACGNGVVTGIEQCDDGNQVDGDGCDHNCQPTGCGNGVVTPPEQCDDGNAVEGDGCDTNCTTSGCGNGIVAGNEQCDDGNQINDDGCDNDCRPPRCGNGIVDASHGETCDDGNAVNGDGCDSNCTPTGCGNGIPTPPEQCDDGNQVNNDGCDTNCTFPGCGNHIVNPPLEQCDDGNHNNDDGCENDCTLPKCGNGIVDASHGEQCDDGNQVNGDGCDDNCTTSVCGNGIVAGSEECDDGNQTNGDGCDTNCKTTRCGNGVVSGTEQCDDGNNANADGCEADCTLPRCGNGVVDQAQGEQCDDGNTADGDGCSHDCKLQEICTDLIDNDGDGLVDCDDVLDCHCQVFGKDPASIVFVPNKPGLDKFKVHGRMTLANASAMFSSKFGVLLTNANGTIFRGVLDAGQLVKKGSGALFKNKTANHTGGLYKVQIKSKLGYVRIQIQSYSDLGLATVPLMGVQVLLAGEEAYYKASWQKRPNGWRLQLPPNS